MRRLQHYTPEDFSNPSSAGQKRKRARAPLSCGVCRDRKVACDRQRPCENCVKLKCPEDCSYDGRDDDGGSGGGGGGGGGAHTAEVHGSPAGTTVANPSNAGLSITNARVARLEGLVQRLAGKVGVPMQALDADLPRDPIDLTDEARKASDANRYADATLDRSRARDAALYVGQTNWVYPGSLDLRFLWRNQRVFAAPLSKVGDIAVHFDHVRRRSLWDVAIMPSPSPSRADDLLNLLPDQKTCDTMVSRFLQTFNVVYPVVSEVHLWKEIAKFWQQKRPESPTWLPFYLAMIALGHQMPLTPPVQGDVEQNGRRTGKAMMEAIVPYAISLAQQARRPNVTMFQTILLVIFHEKLALDWVDGNDLTNGFLGILSRMTATMGLHRDPLNFSDMNEEEVRTRRQLFWTFTFVDMEHVLYSGTPCGFRDDSHDVQLPEESAQGWAPYTRLIAECIPTCAEVIRFSHSRRIQVSSQVRDALSASLRQKPSLDNDTYRASIGTLAYDPSRAMQQVIQQAMYGCLKSKVHALLHWPLLESDLPAVRASAEAQVLESYEAILEHGRRVAAQIQQTDAAAQEAWTHVAIAFLRCPLYGAVSLIMLLYRLRTQMHGSEDDTTNRRLKSLAYETLEFLGQSSALSFDATKHQIYYWLQYYTIHERAQAQATAALSTAELDLDSVAGRQLVTVSQQTIDKYCEQAVAAIERARKLPNPPPNILEVPRQVEEAPSINVDSTAIDDQIAFLDAADGFDWSFAFDDWTMGTGMFDDVTAASPWGFR